MYIRTWHAITLLTLLSGAVTLGQIPSDTWMTPASLSLSFGVAATSLMGAAALLGSRLSVIELLFGGLDRVYVTHKWLGVCALIFASIHFVFRAGSPAWDVAAIVALPRPTTRLVRQLSLVALVFIVLAALNRKIPYHLWRWWHRLSGPLFLIVILHWLSIRSPIKLASSAGAWLASLSMLGVAGAAYKLILYPFVSRHAEYRIVAASPSVGSSALHLELEPVRNPLVFAPGQFAFISIAEEGLREPHPFTIADGADDKGRVHLLIRDLGDYTHRLIANTTVGMHATVYGPHGCFKRAQGAKREIWIAGGVGISPFIAWLRDESGGRLENVTLFYLFTPGREFPSAALVKDLAQTRGAECVTISAGPSSTKFTQRFKEIAQSVAPSEVAISFCGPKALLERVRELMRENRIPRSGIRYEYFEFR